MATGYTYGVQDGTVTEFRDFALKCARAFGALIEMRDDPMDAPIPDAFPVDDYYEKALASAQARVAELATFTEDDAWIRAGAEYDRALKSWRDAEKRREQEQQRYEAMLDQVLAWEAPEMLVSLKTFMVEQLQTSISHDCVPLSKYRNEPVRQSAQEWLADERASADGSLAYYTEQRERAQARAAERTAWVQALKSSLPTHQEV